MTNTTEPGSTNSTTVSKSTRRYWRRLDAPASWWPWGWLPIAGLCMLFLAGALVTAPDIQAEVRDSVGRQLDDAGVRVSAISASGRHVTARVTSNERQDGVIAAIGEAATCGTWAGPLRCPAVVTIERDSVEAAPAKVEIRPHPFEVIRDGESITLRGEVPSAAERDRIVDLAGSYFGRVDDQLTISGKPAGQHYSPAADRALEVTRHLNDGRASWSGEQLSVAGTATEESLTVARAAFDDTGEPGTVGTFDVLAPTAGEAKSCNEIFAETLAEESIRFRTSSADIDAGSAALLERLARVAESCPGNLRIAGHTDSRGDAAMNRALSLARAASVRDALASLGVAPDRITAVGYGETQPISDNDTAEGRARNRRITIEINETE